MVSPTHTPPDRLDIFVRGANAALYHKYRDGSQWSPSWTWIGGTFMHDPVAISCMPGRVDVFAVGVNSSLYSKTLNGTQWHPNPIDYDLHEGRWKSKPCVISSSIGTMDVFLLGYDDAIWHKPYSVESGWGPLESLGGRFVHAPSAVTRGLHDFHVFGVGFDHAVYTKDRHAAGTVWLKDWEKLGGTMVSEVKAMTWGPDHIELFAIGVDSVLWHKWLFSPGWGPSLEGWHRMGGRFQGAPEAFARKRGVGSVLVRDAHCVLQEKYFSIPRGSWCPSGVDNFQSLGGTAIYNVSVICVENHIDLFAVNPDQEVIHKAWWDDEWRPSMNEYTSLGSVHASSKVAATYSKKSTTRSM